MRLFGTDGIRGKSAEFPFGDYELSIIGKAIAETAVRDKGIILIIRDTRESGLRIQKALAKGISDAGCKTVFGGVMPTPAASYLVKKKKFGAAIVISASHNPYEDNGIKIFNSSGHNLNDSISENIEK